MSLTLRFNDAQVEVNAAPNGARLFLIRDPESGITVHAEFTQEDAAVLGHALSKPIIEVAAPADLSHIRPIENGGT